MTEVKEIELSPEQEHVLEEVETMVLSAIGAQCTGCSTANFAPRRIGMAVARERLSQDTAVAIAERFNVCAGLGKIGVVETCHYPSPK